MARVTVEDCLKIVPDRFELVILATKRARELMMGASPVVEAKDDPEDIVALREIASGFLDIDRLRRATLYDLNKNARVEEEDTIAQESLEF